MAEQVGAPRIIVGGRIPHPCGNPDLPAEREHVWRRRMVLLALEAARTAVKGPTVFSLESSDRQEKADET